MPRPLHSGPGHCGLFLDEMTKIYGFVKARLRSWKIDVKYPAIRNDAKAGRFPIRPAGTGAGIFAWLEVYRS